MINWSTILTEIGGTDTSNSLNQLANFAYGNMSTKEFGRFGKNCRSLLRRGGKNARMLAQRAIRHRMGRKARRAFINA